MLRPHLKNTKKIEIHLTLKQQKHPWDIAAEKAEAKHYEEKKVRADSVERSHKKSSLKQAHSIQLHQILIPLQETNPPQSIYEAESAFEESEEPDEGFFLCPFCTCWFTHQKDLHFHIKKWCNR